MNQHWLVSFKRNLCWFACWKRLLVEKGIFFFKFVIVVCLLGVSSFSHDPIFAFLFFWCKFIVHKAKCASWLLSKHWGSLRSLKPFRVAGEEALYWFGPNRVFSLRPSYLILCQSEEEACPLPFETSMSLLLGYGLFSCSLLSGVIV